ncbi:putative defense protein 3 [Saccostrea echinata]|uniref:putative defense protein 3 n=1 Tax=Saccostrea echinata TaxID=191078 RepID=UPI002A7F8EF7|nr:putative defense protein 3 [Saccostrea echinata]
MKSLLLCLNLLIVAVIGYPSGAPPSVCETMVPGHRGAVQTGASSFTLTMNSTSYTAGDVIEVTVSGGTFRGIFIQARSANCSTVTLPTFSLMTNEGNLKTLTCNSVADSAVTHTTKSDKTQAKFYWTPAANVGHIYFRATVVQVYSTYWVGIQSSVLRDSNSSDPVPNSICQPEGSTTVQTPGGNSGNGGVDLQPTLSFLTILLMTYFLTR